MTGLLLKSVPTRDVGLAMATVDVAARARGSWGQASGTARSTGEAGRAAPH